MKNQNEFKILQQRICVDFYSKKSYMILIECQGNEVLHLYKVQIPVLVNCLNLDSSYYPINLN